MSRVLVCFAILVIVSSTVHAGRTKSKSRGMFSLCAGTTNSLMTYR